MLQWLEITRRGNIFAGRDCGTEDPARAESPPHPGASLLSWIILYTFLRRRLPGCLARDQVAGRGQFAEQGQAFVVLCRQRVHDVAGEIVPCQLFAEAAFG